MIPNLGRFRDLALVGAATIRQRLGLTRPYRARHYREHGAGATVPLRPIPTSRFRGQAQVRRRRPFVTAGVNSGRHSAP